MARLLLLRGSIGAGKSAVADRIRAREPEVAVIEVDDFKKRKFETTAWCDPPVDFLAAGKEAKEHLLAGRDTIVIEAFCERQHLEWVLGPSALQFRSSALSVVWLECDLHTSLQRKEGVFADDVVRQQHTRYASRFRVPGEHVINTVDLEVDHVATQVLGILRPAGPTIGC